MSFLLFYVDSFNIFLFMLCLFVWIDLMSEETFEECLFFFILYYYICICQKSAIRLGFIPFSISVTCVTVVTTFLPLDNLHTNRLYLISNVLVVSVILILFHFVFDSYLIIECLVSFYFSYSVLFLHFFLYVILYPSPLLVHPSLSVVHL